jgi:hypothetical protein
MCTSFKQELLNGIHAFGTSVVRAATTADSFKAALYLAAATMNAATTAYTATNEASGTGYTAGGVAITSWNAPATSGTAAYTTPTASFAWTTVTFTAVDTVLIYNSTQSNRAVSVHTFSSQTVTAGNFSLTMPTNAAGTALLQLS